MAKSIEARLLSTRGPGKEAILEIDGSSYTVRDGFSWSADQAPAIGDIFDVELSATLDEDEAWDEKFCGNPEHRIGLESTGGWSYRAKGRITSIDPVCVDCGLLVESRVIYTSDPRVLGEHVAFKIVCLDAY